MRKITKIKRSVRAISPVISVLLMIAIAVVASLVAYAWIMGYIGGNTTKSGNSIQIQNYVTGSNLIVYVQNTGQGIVHLKQDGSVYVNDVLQNILTVDDKDVVSPPGQLIPINVGQTVKLVVNCPFNPGDRIKIATVEGTFMQVTGNSGSSSNSGSGSQTQVQVTFTASPTVAGTVSPSGTQTYTTGTIIPISATANNGYTFPSWTFTGSIQINNPTSASTTAQINGAGTVTANFISSANPRLALTTGAGQSILVSSVSSVLTIQRQDSSGNPVTTGSTTITLTTTSSTGTFYSDSGGTTQITSITISSPASSANVYYEDTSAGTPTLTASATGYSPVSTTFTINSLTPTPSPSPSPTPTATPTPQLDHFTITVPSSATAGSSFSITVTAQDQSDNTFTGYTGTVHFTSSDNQAVLPAASGLTSGTGTFTVTLKTAGSETITATDGSISSISSLITVNAAAASKLVYTVGTSQSLTINDVSSMITVQRQDQYGNPATTGGISVTLSSSSNGGRFYSDSAGNQRIYSVNIADGSSSANFYYLDQNAGIPTITASLTGLTSATTQFTINSYQLVYTNGASQSLSAGTVSQQITIQRQDQYGNSYRPSTTITIQLTSTSIGKFYSDSSGTTQITSININSGSSTSSSFSYKDITQGTPTLTGSCSGYTPATTTFTITGPATQLKFTAGASQSIFVSQVSSVITVAQQDASGHGVNAVAALTVNLAATSTTGAFYNNAQGTGTPITQVIIAAGSNSANFYYEDTTAGSSTITASSTGLTSATTTFTITQNQVPDGGFDQSGPWTSGGTGYSTSHETNDAAPPLSGAYAELDTTVQGSSGTFYGSLTNSFAPVALSSIPNTAGSFSMWIYNNGYSGVTGYYSFQITVTASNGQQLIYWWGNNGATPPTGSSTVKVINMGTLPGMFTTGQWVQFSRNLYSDWTGQGLSSSANINSLALQCNGYRTGSTQYGQEIFIDNVQIQ